MVSENQILEETKKDLLAEALEAEVEKDERAAKESDVLNQVVEMASTEGRKEVEEEETYRPLWWDDLDEPFELEELHWLTKIQKYIHLNQI